MSMNDGQISNHPKPPDNLFLLDSRNKYFVNGKKYRGIFINLLIGFFITLALAFIIAKSGFLIILLCVYPFMAAFILLWDYTYIRHFLFDGQVLYGKIEKCHSLTEKRPWWNRRKYGSQIDFHVFIDYSFNNPKGRPFVDKVKRSYSYQWTKPLPNADTPIAILYFNDDDYRLL